MKSFNYLLFCIFLCCSNAYGAQGDIKWQYQAGAEINGIVFDLKGNIYIKTNNNLHAINKEGASRWKKELPSTASTNRTEPVVTPEGNILYISENNLLTLLYPDGNTKWTYNAPKAITSKVPAVASDGTIYFGSSETVYALTSQGKYKWEQTAPGILESPVIDSTGTIYVTTQGTGNNSNTIYAFSNDGTTKWSIKNYRIFGPHWSHFPIINKNGALLLKSIASLAALSPQSMKHASIDVSDSGSPVIDQEGNYYFALNWDNKLTSYSSSGQERWSIAIAEIGRGTPVIDTDGTAYVAANGALYAISNSGTLLWSKNIGHFNDKEMVLMIDHNTLYIRAGNNIYAIEGSYTLADSAWPTYRKNNQNTGAPFTVAKTQTTNIAPILLLLNN